MCVLKKKKNQRGGFQGFRELWFVVHRRLVIPASDRYVRELAAVLSDDSSWIEGAGHAEKSQWSALRGGM